MSARIALLAAALSAGCNQPIELISRDGGSDAAGSDLGGCPGGPVHIGSSMPTGCAASLAASLLRHALCACEGLPPGGAITTDAFDSSGAAVPPDRAAAVGAGGDSESPSTLTLGGSLELGGAAQAQSPWKIAETLRADGDLVATASVTVAGDAWVNGNLSGPVAIAGTLHLPADKSESGGVTAGAIVREPVTLAEPCPCDDGARVPVAVVVAAHADSNDDAAIALRPGDLANLAAPTTLALDCGQYYVTAIGTNADLTLVVHGRAALHVDGPVRLGGSLTVALDPDAELDLLVAGGFSASGGVVGDPAHAARVRIWLSSGNELALAAAPTVGAALYAPGCELSAPAGAHLSGAALVGSLSLGGPLRVSYDRALLAAGNLDCGTPAEPPVP